MDRINTTIESLLHDELGLLIESDWCLPTWEEVQAHEALGGWWTWRWKDAGTDEPVYFERLRVRPDLNNVIENRCSTSWASFSFNDRLLWRPVLPDGTSVYLLKKLRETYTTIAGWQEEAKRCWNAITEPVPGDTTLAEEFVKRGYALKVACEAAKELTELLDQTWERAVQAEKSGAVLVDLAAKLAADNARLTTAIQVAPHTSSCILGGGNCKCWKARALREGT